MPYTEHIKLAFTYQKLCNLFESVPAGSSLEHRQELDIFSYVRTYFLHIAFDFLKINHNIGIAGDASQVFHYINTPLWFHSSVSR